MTEDMDEPSDGEYGSQSDADPDPLDDGPEEDGQEEDGQEEDGQEGDEQEEEEEQADKKKKKHSKMVGDAKSYSDMLAKRGVIYLGRVPPFMKPNKLRSMLDVHGEITRLFLQEEDHIQRKKRMSSGGNGSKQFVEGWVEFADKKIAKNVARALNNTLIGGKKRNFYHDDMWNLKYLKGFRWDHLTEKFAYERRVREAKLRAGMIEAKKKNAEFANLVEQSKTESYIKNRIKKREASDALGTDNQDEGKRKKRLFRQSHSLGRHHGENSTEASKNLLKHVFSS
ncbi:unnamed protein product [Ectocarpus fasciculatus]